jgi:6,7-dimethyl-8-ribityllumazine synthase
MTRAETTRAEEHGMSGEGRPEQPDIPDGSGIRLGVAAATWHTEIVDALLERALATAGKAGSERPTVVRVPGTVELPVVCQQLARDHDAVVALGVVIRGGTPHFEYVAGEATKGVAQVAMEAGCAVTMGVLTCDTMEQALERAGVKAGNKGAEAALAAIEQANVLREAGKIPAPRRAE